MLNSTGLKCNIKSSIIVYCLVPWTLLELSTPIISELN